MIDRIKKSAYSILILWLLIIAAAVSITLCTPKKTQNVNYEQMLEASKLAQTAMGTIKQYKIDNNIGISEADVLSTGMIGSGMRTSITTTEGVLEAKRTSCNPNWSAVIIQMFMRAKLKAGDEVGMMFSGSFPAMNICALAAAQVYGLKTCVMAGIGASYYGANQPDFTFFDMSEYLCDKDILTVGIDYVSLGGNDDIGSDFRNASEKNAILNRINQSDATYIYEEDFKANIDLRLSYFDRDIPDMKFFLNVGGTMVSFGKGLSALNGNYSGFYSATTIKQFEKRKDDYGLLQCLQLKGLPVASLINIKNLAVTYGIPYDSSSIPSIGSGPEYYVDSYSVVYPIIALVLSIGFCGFFFYLRRKGYYEIDDEKRFYFNKKK